MHALITGVPGFTWIRVGLSRRGWRVRTFWPLRGFVKTRQLGPVVVSTLRSDCVERGIANGTFPPDFDKDKDKD